MTGRSRGRGQPRDGSRTRAVLGRGVVALALVMGTAAAQADPIDAKPATFTQAEIDAVAMPDLHFAASADATQDFEKFFFFHRDDTDFATAYADLRECDNFARGIAFHTADVPAPYGYGLLPGAIGGAIGNVLADAIFGSAQRRLTRRINLRTCMAYKGYDRYGLPKDRWDQFNFEEGNRTVSEEDRRKYLMQQAKVASGPKPEQGELPR